MGRDRLWKKSLLVLSLPLVLWGCPGEEEPDGEQDMSTSMEDMGSSGPANCEPTLAQEACEMAGCDYVTEKVYLVQGEGQDCMLVEQERSACFDQTNTCMNACVAEYFAYDLGEGRRLVVEGLQGRIGEDWSSIGQTNMECPALPEPGI